MRSVPGSDRWPRVFCCARGHARAAGMLLLASALLIGALLIGTAAPLRAQTAGEAGAEESAAQEPASEKESAEVTYEIFVQSFCDADGDGIGDFAGMTSKLDYLERMGAGRVWLMPIQPSPSYHKYDVTDYRAVHPDYGTMQEFKAFVDSAHARGIEVIMDLVLNHTARAHPWFQSAVEDGEESPYRDYYVWATEEEVADSARAAARGGELEPDQWHDAPGEEDFYGFFWGGMPDLNFDNPEVRAELIDIGQFWLDEVGVDGFRLDAARHIYPDHRAEDSQQWWAEFREAMQEVDPDVYLVGEVWGTTEEAVPYFRGLDALFNFDLSAALQGALETGVADSLAILHEEIRSAYRAEAEGFSDATFLANHDQNRIRSVLGGSLEKAEMGAALLFTLPGDPYIYYGEEIGMLGKKPDPHIREPFLWNAEAAPSDASGNASEAAAGEGGASGNACRADWIAPIYSTDETVTPARAQARDSTSLLRQYRRLIELRKSEPALAEGGIEPVATEAPSVSAFLRTHESDTLLVVHNVASRNVEVELPERLRGFTGRVWAKAGVSNADQGNSALQRGEEGAEATPKRRAGRSVWMPGLSTLVLRHP